MYFAANWELITMCVLQVDISFDLLVLLLVNWYIPIFIYSYVLIMNCYVHTQLQSCGVNWLLCPYIASCGVNGLSSLHTLLQLCNHELLCSYTFLQSCGGNGHSSPCTLVQSCRLPQHDAGVEQWGLFIISLIPNLSRFPQGPANAQNDHTITQKLWNKHLQTKK